MTVPSRSGGLEAPEVPSSSAGAGLRERSTRAVERIRLGRREPSLEAMEYKTAPGGGGPTAKSGVPPSPTAGGRGGAFSLARDLARAPSVGRTLALGDGDAAEVRSASEAQRRQLEMFSVATPPLRAGCAQSDAGGAAPRRYPIELGRDGPVGGWPALRKSAQERSDDSPSGGLPLLITKRLSNFWRPPTWRNLRLVKMRLSGWICWPSGCSTME
jgi:hypothetical protein